MRPVSDLLAGRKRLPDVGCGNGNSLEIAHLAPGTFAVGVDIDRAALRAAKARLPLAVFVLATAEALPFRNGVFDAVMSNVALPYTDIPAALREMRRVSATDALLWAAMHSFGFTLEHWFRSIRNGAWKDVMFRTYVIINGPPLPPVGPSLSLSHPPQNGILPEQPRNALGFAGCGLGERRNSQHPGGEGDDEREPEYTDQGWPKTALKIPLPD